MVIDGEKVIKVAFQVAPWIYCAVLIRSLDKQQARYRSLYAMTGYMMNILEENEVELSEFDLIALNQLIQED